MKLEKDPLRFDQQPRPSNATLLLRPCQKSPLKFRLMFNNILKMDFKIINSTYCRLLTVFTMLTSSPSKSAQLRA